MTEAEWLGCDDLWTMLYEMLGRASDRKLRLLAVACGSPLLENVRIPEVPLAGMVAAAERFADGLIDVSELSRTFPKQRGSFGLLREMPVYATFDGLCQRTCEAVALLGWSPSEEPRWREEFAADGSVLRYVPWPWLPGEYAVQCTHRAVTCAAQAWAIFASGYPYLNPRTYGLGDERARFDRLQKERHAWSADVCRDVFGNPFRPVALDSAWLRWDRGTVTAIARHIYDERAFHDLPVLADTLSAAGCDNVEIIAHCRTDGPHARGCWVVDLILRKQ